MGETPIAMDPHSLIRRPAARNGRAPGPTPRRVLLVEPAGESSPALHDLLGSLGWDVYLADVGDAAMFACETLRNLSPPAPEAILDRSGDPRTLSAILQASPGTAVIRLVALGTAEQAMEAMRAGAFDFLAGAPTSEALGPALERVERRNEGIRPAVRIEDPVRFEHKSVVGAHPRIVDVLTLVAQVAPTLSTVLLLGETGTGKEVVARAIHARSARREGPFVAVNCSAIPEPLLESELFGHEKGSYTGAVARRLGLAERAGGGTLFLDEIGDLSLATQPKLLRMLQEREVTRVGGETSVPVDARIIVATHRDLAALALEGRFRSDLFWRLNVFPITLPPLRERASDVPLLADHFLRQFGARAGLPAKRLGAEALELLCRYRWPGNVRELESVLERASILSRSGEIAPESFSPEILGRPLAGDERSFRIPEHGFDLEVFERALIVQALTRCDGVVARAARMLGLSYRTLHYRLGRYGMRNRS